MPIAHITSLIIVLSPEGWDGSDALKLSDGPCRPTDSLLRLKERPFDSTNGLSGSHKAS